MTLEKPCGTRLWPMYWQTSVHVIGAISLILFEFTYNIFPLAEAICLSLKMRIDDKAGCQGN